MFRVAEVEAATNSLLGSLRRKAGAPMVTMKVIDKRWILAWDRGSLKKRSLCTWDVTTPMSPILVDLEGHVLRMGIAKNTVMALLVPMQTLFGGSGRPKPHFWSATTGDAIDMNDLEGISQSEFAIAWGGAFRDPCVAGEYKALAQGRNVVLTHGDDPVATWLTDGATTTHFLDTSGRIGITTQGGDVRFVQLKRGVNDITLDALHEVNEKL